MNLVLNKSLRGPDDYQLPSAMNAYSFVIDRIHNTYIYIYVYTVYVYTDLPKILKLHKIQCSSFFHFSRLVQELMAADAWQRD